MNADSDSDSDTKEFDGFVNTDLIEVREQKAPGTTEVDFDGLLHTKLKLHEDLKEGCGGQLWPAGMVLGKYMLRDEQLSSLVGKQMSVHTLKLPARPRC